MLADETAVLIVKISAGGSRITVVATGFEAVVQLRRYPTQKRVSPTAAALGPTSSAALTRQSRRDVGHEAKITITVGYLMGS